MIVANELQVSRSRRVLGVMYGMQRLPGLLPQLYGSAATSTGLQVPDCLLWLVLCPCPRFPLHLERTARLHLWTGNHLVLDRGIMGLVENFGSLCCHLVSAALGLLLLLIL